MKSQKSFLSAGCPILSRVGARFSDDSVRIPMGRTGIRTGTFILPLILLLVSLCPLPTFAATLYVDDDACPTPGTGTLADPYCSIQTAINAAVDTDLISVAPGTYFEKINFIGKAITLKSIAGPDLATIDATGLADSVVKCVTGEGLGTVLEGFTITGGTGDPTLFSSGPVGGGMLNRRSSPTVNNCVFINNTATDGGGMENYNGSSPTVSDCSFIHNVVLLSGGGMDSFLNCAPTVVNCKFDQNESLSTFSSQGGGGMSNIHSTSSVRNCTFTNNTAASEGGGIANDSSDVSVVNCSFFGNQSTAAGGGIYNFFTDLTVANCILWGNSDAGGMDESAQIHAAFSSSTSTVVFSDVQGGWTGLGGVGNINADPLFVDAVMGDLRLSPGSPCIDAGTNSVVTETTDLDGNPRIVNCPVDMGAYENQTASNPFVPVHNVTQNTFFCTLRAAIDAAIAGDVIQAAPGIYHETINFLGKAITLRSTAGPDQTTIDGTGLNDSVVKCITAETPATVLDGFTIAGGTGDTTGSFTRGGGMLNVASSPTIINCIFRNNTAISDSINPLRGGGGMFNDQAHPIVINCLFTQNATFGAGGGINNSNSNPTITNCTFARNTANRSGAIFNWFSRPVITNCIAWDNGNEGIFTGNGLVTVAFSDVQGGIAGIGNIDAAPQFIDPNNGNFRLAIGSPSIDAGDNTAVPVGTTSDLAGNPRFIDNIITPNTGNGTAPIVDMGAYEAPATVPADIDFDGDVDTNDFAFFAACYNKSGNPPRGGCSLQQSAAFDFDNDHDVDTIDFATFASCYNKAGHPPRPLGCPQN